MTPKRGKRTKAPKPEAEPTVEVEDERPTQSFEQAWAEIGVALKEFLRVNGVRS